MNVLLTGGAGYIGSHTATVLCQQGHRVVLFDNFSNSTKDMLPRLERITGVSMPLVEGDVRDTQRLTETLRNHQIDAVVHFAGLKAVADSVRDPVHYYANNVQGSISLLQAMREAGTKTLVFSSSATVYGEPQYLPYDEDHPTQAINPYGRNKLFVEEMLRDLALSDPAWRILCLRYFNPVGAHDSGLIGESPRGTPNNLMPYVAQVAAGLRPHLQVFGSDYATPDGTGVRDYIHVMDLAEGHLKALEYLQQGHAGCQSINLGGGVGTSVLELVHAFERASGRQVPVVLAPRRAGDLPAYYARADKALALLNWRTRRSVADMCESTWRWQASQQH